MTKERLPGFPPPGWELQGQRLDGEDVGADYVRETGIHIARSCVGLKPSDVRYQDALYPWDPQAAREDMVRKQHKCALTVLMILRAMGFALPEDEKALAWRYGWWKPPPGVKPPADPMAQLQALPGWQPGARLPDPGSAMIIGRLSEPSSTHALFVTGYENSGHKVVSVDGGMGAVREARRDVVQMCGDLCLRDKMGNRPILGTLDVVAMRDAGMVVREYAMLEGR